jgi:hypothetical protein
MHRLDELLPVYVVFRTPLLEDKVLKSYLDRVVVNVDVFAFGTAPGPDQEAKALPKELIYSETIKDTNEPTIVLHESGDTKHAYVFWKVEVPIGESRPQHAGTIIASLHFDTYHTSTSRPSCWISPELPTGKSFRGNEDKIMPNIYCTQADVA